ncbi:SfnB family sulfur acquisition oxidoreductase [Rhizobiales bacterium RZME27]|uniref:SfnB family sulfur acquisition oxidoreductase n=1 Tax=Endobacterium cereale TaxID=2663029 RepID=A0A6A8ADC7_9HYPH|nr:SfnB family sulfur acquisition oxidoreductase [Endobacterium cereale]MEB2847476.1 SfnB family sulfur acquisition oxidoreductase [Endobacterium cereale]MQY49325.1 SfnB family sulfur acquisition oxidoreductase [Endobacterium cereale]
MGSVVGLAAKLRAVAPYIAHEDQAIDIAKSMASRLSEGSSLRDRQRILPHHEMQLLAQSGLLGVTVPAEYGGADISNPFLAEMLAILSEADSSIGQIPQNHFYILDVLRLAGSEEQKRYFFTRALAGDHFANALAERDAKASGDISTRLVQDGPGYRISGRKYYSTGALFADWIAIFALDVQDRLVMAIVARESDGLSVIDDWSGFGQRTTASGTVVIDNLYVSADAVIESHKAFSQPAPLGALAQLLHAAVDLGIARAAFADMVDFVRTKARGNSNLGIDTASHDPLTVARAGSIAVKIEAAAAVLERAGSKIDIAQVSPSAEVAAEASIAVASAKILTTEAALEATNALFELAGTSSTDESFNFDRHWRNARTHTVHDPVRWKHHAIGDFHLNGKLPEPNGQF